MARIGGQELNFGAGVEGFLTKFAEGRANDPTRKALAQLKAKQAVEEAAKINIINRDILPYISNETERETIAEKLLSPEGPSFNSIDAVARGLVDGTLTIGTTSQTKQPGVLDNRKYTNWANTGIVIGQKGTKQTLEEQRLDANIKVKSRMDQLKQQDPTIVDNPALYKQEIQKFYNNNLSTREKVLYREYLFGTGKASAETDLRIKIAKSLGVLGTGLERETIIPLSIKNSKEYRDRPIRWLIQNHPEVNSQYFSMLFGLGDMNPKVMELYSNAEQTAQVEHQLQKDSLTENLADQISDVAAADISDVKLNEFLIDQAEGLRGLTPTDIINSELFQPAALEQIIRSRPPGKDPVEYTEEITQLISVAAPNIQPVLLNKYREILRERLENIRS